MKKVKRLGGMAEDTETNGASFHVVAHFLGGKSRLFQMMVSVLDSQKRKVLFAPLNASCF